MTKEIIINEKSLQAVLKRYDELEQENKELKEETLQWKQIKYMANNNKYRSALEEIREIAKDIIENDVYENSDVKAEKILTKINECIGE